MSTANGLLGGERHRAFYRPQRLAASG
jgi:hypothetical protein